jgi:hypothetical protein
MAKTELRRYIYTPLGLTRIRILEVHPGDEHMPLSCRLFEARSTPVQFEALSYAWGEPTLTDSFTETDSNSSIHITRNLHQALLNLRQNGKSRWLWVDAVCINQSDNDEKSSQVANMANLYKQAERVLVWIGYDELGHKDCEETMRTLIELAEDLPDTSDGTLTNVHDDYDGPKTEHTSVLKRPTRKLQSHKVEQEKEWRRKSDAPEAKAQRYVSSRNLIRSCNVIALDSFFGKAWFKRVWVVQEFVLARELELFAGLDSITYPQFKVAVLTPNCCRYLNQKQTDSF